MAAAMNVKKLSGRFTVVRTDTSSVVELKSSAGAEERKSNGRGASFSNSHFGAVNYPTTRATNHVDTIHGVKVADPYRWLEDPDSAETEDWVRRQNVCTNAVLDKCDLQPMVLKRMTEQYNYEKMSVPFRRGDRFFVFKIDGLQNQPVLYTANSADALYTDEARVLLDLNAERADGTLSLRVYSLTEDGALLACGLSDGGSDWMTIKVVDVATGKYLDDTVPWVKFCDIVWKHDNSGFFFARYPVPRAMLENPGAKSAGTETETNENQEMLYHKLGTAATDDQVVIRDPEHPQWKFDGSMSDDGSVLIISTDNGCDPVNRLAYVDLSTHEEGKDFEIHTVVDNFDAGYQFLANNGRRFYFKTNLDAPRYRVVSLVLPAPGAATPEVLAGLKFREIRDLENPIRGSIRELKLPTLGSVASISARRSNNDLFLKFTSFLYPGSVLRYKHDPENTGELRMTVFKESKVPGFDASNFVTYRTFATSKDGTQVPLFVTQAKKSVGKPCPTILYGYGGFNISIGPYFSPLRLVWLQELGGAFVVANIRGGGEYGGEWHAAGKLFNKQNVFDDFCASGEHLISRGVTTKHQLAIFGGSNGGLLVLACALQRPDLFAAGLSAVPVTDMLRFHKFTIGHAWCTDYGNADNSRAELNNLLAYSPLHNVRAPKPGEAQLPALLITTGDHDDRVVPLHSFKMTATLQEVAGRSPVQTNPLVVSISVKAGHGAGKPTSVVLREYSQWFSFLAKYTGAVWSAPAATSS